MVLSFTYQQFVILRSYKNNLGQDRFPLEFWRFRSLLLNYIENRKSNVEQVFRMKHILVCLKHLSLTLNTVRTGLGYAHHAESKAVSLHVKCALLCSGVT
jgi:hypothetical protein